MRDQVGLREQITLASLVGLYTRSMAFGTPKSTLVQSPNLYHEILVSRSQQ